jgi:hypothetical protein
MRFMLIPQAVFISRVGTEICHIKNKIYEC